MSEPGNPSTDPVLPLAEEAITIAKRTVLRGRVRVLTSTETFETIARASLAEERVEVVRVPIDREVTVVPTIRTEGDVTIVPVLEEVLVVEKRIVLKEELHIRKRIEHEDLEVPVTLRRQHAAVERIGSGDVDPTE